MVHHSQIRDEFDNFTKILHFGLAAFAILAWATGDIADDYKKTVSLGFYIHGVIGTGAGFFIAIRILYGIVGPRSVRFMTWVPFTKERIDYALADLKGLLAFKLPERQPRQGIAALVEVSGLLILLFLAITGVMLFFIIEPGHKTYGFIHFVKELHESGEILLPFFLSIHAGAVILHAMAGNHLWKKMIFWERS